MTPPTARRARPALIAIALLVALVVLAGCGGSSKPDARSVPTLTQSSPPPDRSASPTNGYQVPPLLDPHNVYAADFSNELSPTVAHFPNLVYVPNSGSNTVDVIDPNTYRVVREFPVGALPQHVVPSYDLRTLWVTNDLGNSLTPINPATGLPGPPVPVVDPYNLYFTPDGRYAIVISEAQRRMDFRDSHTMRLVHTLNIPQCAGLNHGDYTADGRLMVLSCEFGSRMVVVDIPNQRLVRVVGLPTGASPQDVKLAPDGSSFYVADLNYGGVWVISATTFQENGLIMTGAGAHGLYPSRDARSLYVSNRTAGTVSVISFATRRVTATWTIPSGSPDMGGVSASGRVLWLSGRYDASVYAIDTRTGKLLARVPVGYGPHGLSVYPQPGRYSLGHTENLR